MLVTGDAIHCQAETARLVAERGGDWLFALKANRPAMLAEGAALFADPRAVAFETRRHLVCHDVRWLFSDRRYPHEPSLPALATLAMVEAEI